MKVLSVVHGPEARAELFEPAVTSGGHTLDEWSFSWATPPPQPFDDYDAYFVFGGAMHPDQDHLHPWYADELAWLERLIEEQRPVLGVCLGVQLLARAAGAEARRLDEAEIGWIDVELNDAGVADPVLGSLPRRFNGLVWHQYTYDVPDGAVELARTDRTTQAFRLGDACWGVQFHPEVTAAQLDAWSRDFEDPPPNPEALRAETPTRIGEWNTLGRTLCTAFLETVAVAA
ncbi:MAG TPA: type 1 glutamine amidotransferase [Gaiellaceae bacterium]|nr:type 1 glutamine amidotransferase [Gaiellaceae bacterium]